MATEPLRSKAATPPNYSSIRPSHTQTPSGPEDEREAADEEANGAERRLHRGLSARQVQMIAIGGTIGTGIFLSAGSASPLRCPRSRPQSSSPRTYRQSRRPARPAPSCRTSQSACSVTELSSRCTSYIALRITTFSHATPSSGEMAAYIPVSGSFSVFGSRFFSPALGFTLGTLHHITSPCIL